MGMRTVILKACITLELSVIHVYFIQGMTYGTVTRFSVLCVVFACPLVLSVVSAGTYYMISDILKL